MTETDVSQAQRKGFLENIVNYLLSAADDEDEIEYTVLFVETYNDAINEFIALYKHVIPTTYVNGFAIDKKMYKELLEQDKKIIAALLDKPFTLKIVFVPSDTKILTMTPIITLKIKK